MLIAGSVSIETDKDVYKVGDTIRITVRVNMINKEV